MTDEHSTAAAGFAAPPARRSGPATAVLLAAAAAVTAATLLGLRLHFEPPTVPVYEAAAAGSAWPSPRARPPARLLRAGEPFELKLRPTAAVAGAVGARAFLVRGDEVRPWDPPFDVERDGTLRIAGAVERLFAGVPLGEWVVAVSVGRPEVLPTAPKDILRAQREAGYREAGAAARDAAWRLVEVRIVLGG